MKQIIHILAIIVLFSGCTKDNEISVFTTGTYHGEKITYYSDTQIESTDTITIWMNNHMYEYSCSSGNDFGIGSYILNNNSIEFNDEAARIDLYSWDWILSGTFIYRTSGDSLILNQTNSYRQISCRLKKSAK